MAVPVIGHPRGRPRDPRRQEAILQAAIALVCEVGFDRMTVDALAARAGVSKPTLYRRWPGGKAQIIVDAIRTKRAAAWSVPDAGSLRGDLVAVVESMVEHIDSDAHLAGGLISQLRSSAELAELFREEVVRDERRRFDALLARAAERGELPPPASITPLFADIAGSVVFTRVAIAGEPVDASFIAELVDRVLIPILTFHPRGA